jgi:hypothetical protein
MGIFARPAGRKTLVTLTLSGLATVAAAAPKMQPPMNSFDFAFYTCDAGGAFQITYDSDTPTSATLTTNDHNKQYTLMRRPIAEGVQFANGEARFWTDGKKVVVDGTRPSLANCKRMAN